MPSLNTLWNKNFCLVVKDAWTARFHSFLCMVDRENGKISVSFVNIFQLLTKVNNRVAKINTQFIDDRLKVKQTLCFRNSVCEDLYFD